MKKLEEYETPETDTNSFVETNAANALVMASFARDLERRLAMCRDALRDISDTVTKGATLARKTLKATEPK